MPIKIRADKINLNDIIYLDNKLYKVIDINIYKKKWYNINSKVCIYLLENINNYILLNNIITNNIDISSFIEKNSIINNTTNNTLTIVVDSDTKLNITRQFIVNNLNKNFLIYDILNNINFKIISNKKKHCKIYPKDNDIHNIRYPEKIIYNNIL
jgi:hypothetical protein